MASNPLSASSLSSYIASSLPKDADPQLKTATDAIAIACHAGMLAVGFRLIGLSEDDHIASSGTEAQPLPQEWNSHPSKDFRYAHSQSSMEYLLKIQRLGAKTAIQGIGMGDDKITSFDITTNDYISPSSLPASPTTQSDSDANPSTAAIQAIYITPARLTDLGTQLRTQIIQKLLPSLQKEGYEESPSTNRTTSTTASTSTSTAQNPLPQHPPQNPYSPSPFLPTNPLPQTARPRPTPDFPPPGFDDEYDLHRPPGRAGPSFPPPFNPRYGDADLYPAGLGPWDPLRSGGGGGGGFGAGGGMHPRLGGAGGDGGRYGEGSGQVPFGARYDPVGPGDLGGGFEGGGGGGLGGGGLRRGPGGFGRGGGGGGMGGRPGNPFEGFGEGDFI